MFLVNSADVSVPEVTTDDQSSNNQTETPTTSINQEMVQTDEVKDESSVSTKAETRDTLFSCQFCSSRSFETRDKLFTHLTLVHYIKDIQQKFPYQVI